MIKFFRKIRQNLLSEGETGKYFKYAFGEIILVVIGILIALQINNWNEFTNQIKEEEETLVSLEEELKNNIAILNTSLERNKIYTINTNKSIDSINNAISFSAKSLSNSFEYYPPQLNTFILEDILKSDRKLKTKKKEFISALRKLTSLHSDIKKTEFYLDESWNSRASEFLIKTGLDLKNRNFVNNRRTLLDLEKGGYSKIQVISLLDLYDSLRLSWINTQNRTLKACKEVLELLKNSNE